MAAMSWATSIYFDVTWAKIRLLRNERRALAEIGLLWSEYAAAIPATLGSRAAHIRDIKTAARVMANKEWASILEDFISNTKTVISGEMQDAALMMRAAVEEAITKPNPLAFELIPFNHVPDEALRDVADVKFLDTSLDAWAGQIEKPLLREMAAEMAVSMAAGEGIEMAAARVNRVFHRGFVSATRMSRTAIHAASSHARDQVHAANAHLIKAELFTATLDTATCEICGGYDGTEYRMGSTKPYIPVHVQCRCNYVPVMRSAKELGLGPAEIPAWERESMDGAVPDSLTYSDWFQGSTKARQHEILAMQFSKKKADAYLAGEWMPPFLEQEDRGMLDYSDETARLLLEAAQRFREAVGCR